MAKTDRELKKEFEAECRDAWRTFQRGGRGDRFQAMDEELGSLATYWDEDETIMVDMTTGVHFDTGKRWFVRADDPCNGGPLLIRHEGRVRVRDKAIRYINRYCAGETTDWEWGGFPWSGFPWGRVIEVLAYVLVLPLIIGGAMLFAFIDIGREDF